MDKVEIFPEINILNREVASYICKLANEGIHKRGQFSIALAGGNTPKPIYRVLGTPEFAHKFDWRRTHLFWGDERSVPPDHPESNYYMVKNELLDEISIPEENVHRVPAELDPYTAASRYEDLLRGFFKGEWPRFDIILLGMGEDGHTASLFPHSAGLKEQKRWFIENLVPKKNIWRLTLTKNAINAARNILVIISGCEKAEMVAEVFRGKYDPDDKPIQLIAPIDGKLIWFFDQAAANQLNHED